MTWRGVEGYHSPDESRFLTGNSFLPYGLRDETVAMINSVFSRYKEVDEAVLYGFRAQGRYLPGADIDLALIGEDLTWDSPLAKEGGGEAPELFRATMVRFEGYRLPLRTSADEGPGLRQPAAGFEAQATLR